MNKRVRERTKVNKYAYCQTFANTMIDLHGGNNKVAASLHVTPGAVSYWRKYGIPPIQMVKWARVSEMIEQSKEYQELNYDEKRTKTVPEQIIASFE